MVPASIAARGPAIPDKMDPTSGLPDMVIAVVEAVRGTLKERVVRVMESGILDDGRRERLDKAMASLEKAIDDIKRERGTGLGGH
jgi:hypothetical protein